MIHSAAISAFDQRTVIDHRIVEAEATGKVIGGKTVAFQNAAGDIAAKAALADHVDGLAGIHLIKAFSQLVNRNVLKAFDMTSLVFSDCTGIK